MHQVYFGNLAFRQCEVSKSELFTTEHPNRSKSTEESIAHFFTPRSNESKSELAFHTHETISNRSKTQMNPSPFFSKQEVM
jgi:hypothetical protein